jgi:hypothetical protein
MGTATHLSLIAEGTHQGRPGRNEEELGPPAQAVVANRPSRWIGRMRRLDRRCAARRSYFPRRSSCSPRYGRRWQARRRAVRPASVCQAAGVDLEGRLSQVPHLVRPLSRRPGVVPVTGPLAGGGSVDDHETLPVPGRPRPCPHPCPGAAAQRRAARRGGRSRPLRRPSLSCSAICWSSISRADASTWGRRDHDAATSRFLDTLPQASPTDLARAVAWPWQRHVTGSTLWSR